MIFDLHWCLGQAILTGRLERCAEYARNRATYVAYRIRKKAEKPKRQTLLGELGFSGRFRDLTYEQQRQYMREATRRNKAKKQKIVKAVLPPPTTEEIAHRMAKKKTRQREARRRYYLAHREELLERNRVYVKENREKHREWTRKYSAKRLASNPGHRMTVYLRNRLNEMLKKQGRKSSSSLVFTRAALVERIQQQFQTGMTWENHGQGRGKWHVDHIVPCSKFDLSKPKHRAICFGLMNLRPMWGRENIQKSDKVMKQTELSLA